MRHSQCLIGAGLGFYDGFFGPGTGSFFVFALVRVLGYDFLHASAGAKLLNCATNFAALPDYLVEENARLVQLFGESDSIQLDTYFVYPEELKTVARVQVFRDFVVSKAQRWPS